MKQIERLDGVCGMNAGLNLRKKRNRGFGSRRLPSGERSAVLVINDPDRALRPAFFVRAVLQRERVRLHGLTQRCVLEKIRVGLDGVVIVRVDDDGPGNEVVEVCAIGEKRRDKQRREKGTDGRRFEGEENHRSSH